MEEFDIVSWSAPELAQAMWRAAMCPGVLDRGTSIASQIGEGRRSSMGAQGRRLDPAAVLPLEHASDDCRIGLSVTS